MDELRPRVHQTASFTHSLWLSLPSSPPLDQHTGRYLDKLVCLLSVEPVSQAEGIGGFFLVQLSHQLTKGHVHIILCLVKVQGLSQRRNRSHLQNGILYVLRLEVWDSVCVCVCALKCM